MANHKTQDQLLGVGFGVVVRSSDVLSVTYALPSNIEILSLSPERLQKFVARCHTHVMFHASSSIDI